MKDGSYRKCDAYVHSRKQVFYQTPKKGSGDVKKCQETSKFSKKDKKIYETLRAPSKTNFVIFSSDFNQIFGEY